MTDLHCHIIPGIDDGAKNVSMSEQLLLMEAAEGVNRICFTPHFRFDGQSVSDFLKRRNKAAISMVQQCQKACAPIELKLGSEVMYSSDLFERDVRPLCMEGTRVFLLEFPPNILPRDVTNAIHYLWSREYTPLIAHVERYACVKEDPNLLADWIRAGAYTHVNGSSIVRHKDRRERIFRYMDHGLVHFICTDTHSPEQRPPIIAEAYRMTGQKLGTETVKSMQKIADGLWAGEEPRRPEPEEMKKRLGKWV